MSLTLQKVEELAPDQASLSAAKKLLGANKWQGQGFSQATTTAWGECQGSGSKPYYVVVDVDDYGYKCSCPSRKFPCKHALALMWRYVNDQSPFAESPAPDWVNDWLGRRRKSTKSTETNTDKKPAKSIDKALNETAESEAPVNEEELLKKQAAAAKRAEKTKLTTDASISAGLTELEGWLNDQLRTGVGVFMDKARERTRQIAARLVDAKATAMASRLDELSSVILNQPKHAQVATAFAEFGRIHLLAQAWRQMPDDPDVRRFIHTTEKKDTIAQDPNALRVSGIWQVVGEKVETRKDGLISQATYLARLTDRADDELPFALLLDYHHPTSGFKKSTSTVGSYMVGTLVFYPSRVPSRAFFEEVQTVPLMVDDAYFDGENGSLPPSPFDRSQVDYVACTKSIRQRYGELLTKLPWVNEMPHRLTGGQIVKDEKGNYWYKNEELILPLLNKHLPKLVRACTLSHAFILWQGQSGELLSVVSEEWGFLSCQ